MREMHDVPDLDLLRAFATLHHERHLSRAAIRIGLSQPAMSRVLGRLRAAFGDPLFVRTPRGMLPTSRADELAPQVLAVLDAAGKLIRPAAFDPATLVRTFTIGVSDFFDADLIPRLIEILAREAPGVAITTRPLADDIGDALAGRIDLMLGVRETVPADAQLIKLYDETFVCAVRRDHPRVGKRLSIERFVAERHLLIAPGGNPGSRVDTSLAARGLSRQVVVRVHTFLSAPAIVASSDLILTAPRRVLEPLAKPFSLRLLPPPVDVAGFSLFAAWHPRVHADPAHAWFRAALVAASRH
ncbi:MAG TPA: LysR family transcriptional regulator [Kofleriaceae bacterium]|jgi:DNA-binding transcriptional LysR family regulator|nr:LysR family transcriptional regulator [Kofleriaceae bacterium]